MFGKTKALLIDFKVALRYKMQKSCKKPIDTPGHVISIT
jgi:hypothetical protein